MSRWLPWSQGDQSQTLGGGARAGYGRMWMHRNMHTAESIGTEGRRQRISSIPGDSQVSEIGARDWILCPKQTNHFLLSDGVCPELIDKILN